MRTAQLTNFAEAIGRIRERLNLSRRAMARAVGITKSSIQQYETGRAQPTMRIYERLIKTYGCELDVLNRDKLKGSAGFQEAVAQANRPSPRLADRLEHMADGHTPEVELDRLLLSAACTAAANRLRAGTQFVAQDQEVASILTKLLKASTAPAPPGRVEPRRDGLHPSCKGAEAQHLSSRESSHVSSDKNEKPHADVVPKRAKPGDANGGRGNIDPGSGRAAVA